MGRKAERIEELESELEPTRSLLRTVADMVGVAIDEAITATNIVTYTQRLTQALGSAGVPAPARASRGGRGDWDTFDDDVDEQIDRLKARGLTDPPPATRTQVVAQIKRFATEAPAAASKAMSRHNFASTDIGVANIEAAVEMRDPVTPPPLESLQGLARELGLDPNMLPEEVLHAAHAEILRIKNPGDVVASSDNTALAKGDTLGEAVAFSHQQNADLRARLDGASMIVQRIAGVLQVGSWDKDGTELLERVQRFEDLRHTFKRRIRELERSIVQGRDTDLPRGVDMANEQHRAVIDELTHHLATLMSSKEMADWIKSRPPGSVPRETIKAAAAPLVEPYPFTFKHTDVSLLRVALHYAFAHAFGPGTEGMPQDAPARVDAERSADIGRVFDEVDRSSMATEELVRTMNIVVLPILARQRAARRPMAPDVTPET